MRVKVETRRSAFPCESDGASCGGHAALRSIACPGIATANK